MSDTANPVLMVMDPSGETGAVVSELATRYGAAYTILVRETASEALEALRDLPMERLTPHSSWLTVLRAVSPCSKERGRRSPTRGAACSWAGRRAGHTARRSPPRSRTGTPTAS